MTNILSYNEESVRHIQIICMKRSYAMLFLPREEGQGLVEYALILVLVAVVVIAILSLLGPTIGNVFSDIIRQL